MMGFKTRNGGLFCTSCTRVFHCQIRGAWATATVVMRAMYVRATTVKNLPTYAIRAAASLIQCSYCHADARNCLALKFNTVGEECHV